MGLPSMNPKELEMALKKSGISMQEYEANKRRCEQDVVRYAGKVMGNAAVIGAMTAGCEALALVDDRLAGEGTGKILGINDGILGFVIVGVFTLVWSLYYVAQKEMGASMDLIWNRELGRRLLAEAPLRLLFSCHF